MRSMIIFYFLILSLFSSCGDSEMIIPIEPVKDPTGPIQLCDVVDSDSDFVVDWCNLLHMDTSLVDMTTVPILYENQLISIGSLGDPGDNQFIYFYDIDDGSMITQLPVEANRRTGYHLERYENYLIVSYFASAIEVYDLNTHELVWNYERVIGESNRQWINIVGSEIIIPLIIGGLPYSEASTIVAFDIKTGDRRDIVTVTKSDLDGGSPHLASVQVDTFVNGDVIHYFTVAKLQPDVIETHSVWAYNETQQEYLWKRNELDENIVHNDPPIIFGDALTVIGTNTHTLNKYTGETINSIDVAGNYGFSAPKLHEGRIYAKAAQDDLICIDAATGDLVWYNYDAGQFPQNELTIYKGRLYYSGFQETMFVIDIETGEELYANSTPFSQGRFHIGGQVIDPETDYMYAFDGFRVMRLELLR